MRFILSAFLAGIISSAAVAATDSLIVKGRILNLSGRLYRQAPNITFSRNNIFQPQSELTRQVALEADGTFRTSLPMLYKQEEVYLDYGGLAFTTFLASPGTVEITFNGDSLKTTGKLFYFSGVNAAANNLYREYLVTEDKLFKANPALGAKFYDTYWQKDISNAMNQASRRSELRISALRELSDKNVADPVLNFWVRSLADDERLQNIFEYVLSNDLPIGALLDSLNRLSKVPLTAQRVTWANRFGAFADRKVGELNFQNPSKTKSLPAKVMATLIRNNVAKMSPEELNRIDQIIVNGAAARTDIDFMTKMYARNEPVLNLLFDYERSIRTYSEVFEKTALDFLRARYLVRNFYKFSPAQLVLLNDHVQNRIAAPQFRESLKELVAMEVKDSSDVKKLIAYRGIETLPKEVLPGYWFCASNDRGTAWLNKVLEKYVGKTVYLIKWNLEDEKSREMLDYIPMLRAQLSDQVEFVYVHSTFSEEDLDSKDLVKQYILRHQLKGVHLSLNSYQTMDLLFKLNPMDAGTFMILRPNGKFYTKTAPSPADTPKAVEAILQAGR
jgi:hypothetical protein